MTGTGLYFMPALYGQQLMVYRLPPSSASPVPMAIVVAPGRYKRFVLDSMLDVVASNTEYNNTFVRFRASDSYASPVPSPMGVGGNGPGFSNPSYRSADLGVDSDRNVYIVDAGNDRIQKFDSTGAYLAYWSTQFSNEDASFTYHPNLSVDENNHIYVVEVLGDSDGTWSNQRVLRKYDATGTLLDAYPLPPGTLGSTDNALLVRGGKVFITNGSTHQVHVFSIDGTLPAAPPPTPIGVVLAERAQSIVVAWSPVPQAASYRVERSLSSTGPFSDVTSDLQPYASLEREPRSTRWLDPTATATGPYYYRVAAVNEAGVSAFSSVIAGGPVAGVSPLPLDPLMTLSGGMNPFDFSVSTNADDGIPGGGIYVSAGPSSAPSPVVYVTNWASHRVQRFDNEGGFLDAFGFLTGASWGFDSSPTPSFSTRPNYYSGIGGDADGNFYVWSLHESPWLRRIQKFDGLTGALMFEFTVPDFVHVRANFAADSAEKFYFTSRISNAIYWRLQSDPNEQGEFAGFGSGPCQFVNDRTNVGIVVDSTGDIYMPDRGGARIHRFSGSSRTHTLSWPVSIVGDTPIAIDENDFIYVLEDDFALAETASRVVRKYSKSGALLEEYQISIEKVGSIFVRGGKLYVSDRTSNEVPVYTLPTGP